MVKSMERVKHRFYWVGWRRDVSRFVSYCEACNVIKRPHKKIPVPLTQQLFEKLGVSRSLTTPYNPKRNGLVENFNKILKSMPKTFVYDHKESTGQWDVMLPIFLMAYRSSVHGSTGETPHFMLTGREMKVPIDLLYTKPSEDMTFIPIYVRQLDDRLNKAYALVRNNLKSVQRIQKKRYETNSPEYRSLKEGNFVWYYNPRKAFKGDKHLPWKGPYLVKGIQEDFTVTIQLNPEGELYRTHADKLRIAQGVDMEKWMCNVF
ncbi:uncharacterized protein LOC135496141 [Lineus longissimus]|uniref:uncharacterized protein LOC135496141 n=1 Tax=Lineus longissimus TaxID=88925 RepID=UPI00315D3292